MSVENNRNISNHGLGVVEHVLLGYQIGITQADKDAWIERLENASSRKAYGLLNTDDGAFCALGHLGEASPDKRFALKAELIDKIVALNDIDDLTLPEIAVWVKENVEVTE